MLSRSKEKLTLDLGNMIPIQPLWGFPQGCFLPKGSSPTLLPYSLQAQNPTREKTAEQKGPTVKPQGKLHAPSIPSCHLCPSPAWTTDSYLVLGIRSLVSFPCTSFISHGSAGLSGFLK